MVPHIHTVINLLIIITNNSASVAKLNRLLQVVWQSLQIIIQIINGILEGSDPMKFSTLGVQTNLYDHLVHKHAFHYITLTKRAQKTGGTKYELRKPTKFNFQQHKRQWGISCNRQ